MNTRDAIVSLLAASTQFAELDPMALRTIAATSRPKTLRAAQTVFTEGEPCRYLYILESGRVKFFRMNPEGREQIFRVFERPGDVFCIASAFSTATHIVSATTIAETRLHLLAIDVAQRLAREHPSVGLRMASTAGEHLTHLVSLADDLALKTATGRVAKHLYELTVAAGGATSEKVEISRDRLREEELASMLGTVRVHISRSLTSLADAGAIGLSRHAVTVHDMAILKRFIDGK
jgi:CRP/FNR family transcriptional regulator